MRPRLNVWEVKVQVTWSGRLQKSFNEAQTQRLGS